MKSQIQHSDVDVKTPLRADCKKSAFLVKSRKQGAKIDINAVSSPSAQYTRLCTVDDSDYTAVVTKITEYMKANLTHWVLVLGVRLMVLNGLRVSEMLNIRSSDVMRDGYVFIRGSKGSENRVCIDTEYVRLWLLFREKKQTISDYANRFYVYRLLKRAGYGSKYSGNVNYSITHNARHELGLNMSESGMQIEDIQKVLGHKKTNSTKYYVRKKSK